jgi:ferritin-like protein
MKQNGTVTGKNRTGIALSPIDSKELIEAAMKTKPSMAGDDETASAMRLDYASENEPVGTVPPPASVKGAIGTVMKAAKGESMSVFMDKLGERLAFERSGTRLYDALVMKFKASKPLPGGPALEDLLEIQADEHRHFELLREAMQKLGGDPTAVTPSADIAAVASMGIPQVITDPRTTFKQCLDAILVAELVDNDGWTLLATLAERLGHDALAEEFRKALAEEAEHLLKVRSWLMEATLADGGAKS